MPRPATTPASWRPACRNAAQAVVAMRPVTMARLCRRAPSCWPIWSAVKSRRSFSTRPYCPAFRAAADEFAATRPQRSGERCQRREQMSQSGSFSVRRLFARPGLRRGYCGLLPRCECGLHQPSNRFTPRWDIPLLPTPIVEPAQKFLRHAHFHPLGRTVGIILQRLFQRSLQGVGLH